MSKIDIAKHFKNEIEDFFQNTNKTGWGKNETVSKIKDLWAEFLERYVE